MLAIGLTACDLWPEDDDVSVDLDPDLFGFWVLKDSAGNLLYFWSDEINDWGVPFHKD